MIVVISFEFFDQQLLNFPDQTIQAKINLPLNNKTQGSGCGSVGRAVASFTRGPWFEANFLLTVEKTKKEKRDWEWPNLKKQ